MNNVMEVGDLVDAALVGFDRREPVTIPPLHDVSQWDVFDGARKAMLGNLVNALPAGVTVRLPERNPLIPTDTAAAETHR